MPANPQMPEARRPAPDDASATAETPAPAPKSGGALKAWLPLIITVLLMPALAYATTIFVLLPRIQTGLGITASAQDTGAKPKASAPGAKKITVPLNKLLVNVAGTMASRYLLTSITLVGDGPDFPGRVSKNEPQLRDMASGLMMMKTIENLEKPGARNLLRGELIAGFNTILGNAAVQELYFTEFAIQ